jgi:hypothetical protein
VSTPIEFRQFVRKWTRDDALAGITPVKLAVGPTVNGQQPVDLFAPQPILQFRYREKVHLNGAPVQQFSEWLTVDFVKEGYDDK